MLKIGIPDREGEFEAEALAALERERARCFLLDDDPMSWADAARAVLPGTPLTREEPEAALDVVIGLLPRLWIPAGAPFRPLADEVADLDRRDASNTGSGRDAPWTSG